MVTMLMRRRRPPVLSSEVAGVQGCILCIVNDFLVVTYVGGDVCCYSARYFRVQLRSMKPRGKKDALRQAVECKVLMHGLRLHACHVFFFPECHEMLNANKQVVLM